jgi:hypothetical protein
MTKHLYATGDGRQHGPSPGCHYKTRRASRLAPAGDLRSHEGRRFRELRGTYLGLMSHVPSPIERDQLVQCVMLRLKLDELEADQLRTSKMDASYLPLSAAHDKLLKGLQARPEVTP